MGCSRPKSEVAWVNIIASRCRQIISEYIRIQQTHLAAKHAPLIARYQEIGEIVNHSPRTLLLFNDDLDYYGYSLLYYGRFSAKEWPRVEQQQLEVQLGMRELSPAERFNKLYAEHSPEYFIISKSLLDDESYKDLKHFLIETFPSKIEENTRPGRYVVFDLQEAQQPLPEQPE